MAAGVRTIHRRGRPVLHRDLKPGNIFVGAGQTMKLGDFGMSRYVDLVASGAAAASAGALRLKGASAPGPPWPELGHHCLADLLLPESRRAARPAALLGSSPATVLHRSLSTGGAWVRCRRGRPAAAGAADAQRDRHGTVRRAGAHERRPPRGHDAPAALPAGAARRQN